MGDQFQGIGAFDRLLHHVVGLVEKNAALAPRALLVAPVRVFGGDHRIDIRSYPRIPQQWYRIAGGLQ